LNPCADKWQALPTGWQPGIPEIRNPKSEIRRKTENRNPKAEIAKSSGTGFALKTETTGASALRNDHTA
jgi:hypothetical protein